MFDLLNKNVREKSWLGSIKKCFTNVNGCFTKIRSFLQQKNAIDLEVWQEIEKNLLAADLGIEFTKKILQEMRNNRDLKVTDLYAAIKNFLLATLVAAEKPLQITADKPYVILVIGVNGAGKTTTIAKLGAYFTKQKYSVLFAAGDTFRAAAIEQLDLWAQSLQIPIVKQHSGADSAAVIFDALQAALARKIDILLADTSGRLHTQDNLLAELKKIARVLAKLNVKAPQEILLVLDANIGQNSLEQAKIFLTEVGVTGLIITKLDGTAKGGAIFNIVDNLKLPIRFIGVGEKANDLEIFNAQNFVDAIL